ncbi:MAG: glycosyltransferase family 4 protein [Gemmatimonadota bacterium]
MRVLLHCVYYPPEVGGLESHVATLAEGLVARGHEVRVVTSRSLSGLAAEETRNGVRVRRTWFPSRSPLGWALHALGSVGPATRWADWADILHAQAFASVLPAGIAARRTGRPWLASFHTSHFLARARRPLWKPVLRRLVRWPDYALAASIEIAEVARTLSPGTLVEPLANGVETDRFRPVVAALPTRDGERWVIVPRRLVPKNGVEDLIRAVPRVRERIPGARFLVVGDGPERTSLEALAGELGVSGVVTFLGAKPHDEMPGLLASAEIAVFPSRMEATSVAALEALACERPVVATRVGGLPEIVGEDVGTLVTPGDPEALANGVVKLLEERDLPAMGRRARERVIARWSNARLVTRHLEIYEDLVAGRSVRRPSSKAES